MQLTLSQLDFTVSLNSCHDQIMHKMQVLTNMEIELLRKFQHQINNRDMHYKMVHDVRVLIVNLQEVYKDVKEYFNEMGIQFVYDFFRKIQVLMVCGYNFLSQALLLNVDKNEDMKNKDVSTKGNLLECKVCKCTCSGMSKGKKRQIKQVQHFDYKISMLENEQQKLTSEIQTIYDKMMTQKSMIQKTKPSLAVRELEDMKEHIEHVLQSTNSIFEETYMMKYVEFKNYLTQIKKPEDIVDYFIANMNFNMKEKFLKAMQKAIYQAQNMEERLERKHLRDVEIQTDKIKQPTNCRQSAYKGFSSLKPEKNSTLLTKQRKYNEKMMTEIQYIRKQLNTLMEQNDKLKSQLQKKQTERSQFQQNYETLEQLYTKRTLQLEIIQSENKWLSSEKQTEAKRLRMEIKQLKKQQVETVSQQTQIFLPPNYVNSSTETEIIFFQHQVDNEIINVLKKSNQKMIKTLNEKQRKIRELTANRDDLIRLKDCKNICLGFLEDLREVTTYKLTELNKESIKNSETKIFRQPVIPLNQNTSNNSVMITINKLTEEIKTLLLNFSSSKKRINQKRNSSTIKNSSSSPNSRKNSRNLSKLSQQVEQSAELFFRNTKSRKNSVVSLQKQTQIIRTMQIKKSTYQREFTEKIQNESLQSRSEADQIFQESKCSQKSFQSEEKKSLFNNFDQKMENASIRRSISSSSNRQQNSIIQNQEVKNIIFYRQESVQTDIFKEKIQNQRSSTNQQFIHLCESSQQTDINCEKLTVFEKNFQNQVQQIQRLRNIKTNQMGGSYQSYSTRRQPYIRKPGKRSTTSKINACESERNYITVNQSMPMNENQISASVIEQMNKTQESFSLLKFINPNNDYSSTFTASFNKPLGMTLQSRLETLINPKNNLVGTASNFVVLKKPSQEYQKRTPKLVFDVLKLDRHMKDKKQLSRDSYRNQSFFINTLNQRQSKQVNLTTVEKNQSQKQNIQTKSKSPVFQKSIFLQKATLKQENNSFRTFQHQPLIEVSKKTPLKRQKRFSPKDYQRSDNLLVRAVKQMVLSSESKQTFLKKIQEIYEKIEKQKQTNKIKRIIKTSYTARDLPKQQIKKQTSQIFKQNSIQY